jgi:UDP-glucose 4-epimerase
VEALVGGLESRKYNVGTGAGFSVKEVLRTVEQVTGRKVPFRMGPRRPGDPPALVADSTPIQRELGWAPAYSDLRTIVETAWRWASRSAADHVTGAGPIRTPTFPGVSGR